MKIKKLLFYLLTALLGGCVPIASLHPLFTREDLVFEERLLGIWTDDPNSPETTWQFRRLDEPERAGENVYKLIFSDKEGNKGSFVAHLVKLQNRLLLDIYPSELPWEPKDPNKVQWAYNTLFLIPAHTFIQIDSIEPQLKMRLTVDDKMEELLEEFPDAVEHTSVEDRLVLTASTKELQAFVLRYADDSRAFPNEMVLSRKKNRAFAIPVKLTPTKTQEKSR